MGGDRSDLDEPESQSGHHRDGSPTLVVSRCQPHGVGQADPRNLGIHSRGLGLPAEGWAEIDPISMNPNPRAAIIEMARPLLSYPAASPTGLGKRIPETSVSIAVAWGCRPKDGRRSIRSR